MTIPTQQMKALVWVMVLVALLGLASCNDAPAATSPAVGAGVDSAETAPPLPTPTPVPTETPLPPPTPTPTPRPLAATVNGEPIYLDTFNAELAIQQAQARGEDPRLLALRNVIDNEIMRQEATQRQIVLPESEVDAAIAETVAAIGDDAYALWLAENGYTEMTFRAAVRAELLRVRVLETVTAGVGDSAEMVRARVIETATEEDAAEVVAQLDGEGDFLTLLDLYSIDPDRAVTRGDIGWFARGMLTVPEIEAAAFALQPGAYSSVVTATNANGTQSYYVVLVTDRDPARPYTATQAQRMLTALSTEWLTNARANAEIVVLLPDSADSGDG